MANLLYPRTKIDEHEHLIQPLRVAFAPQLIIRSGTMDSKPRGVKYQGINILRGKALGRRRFQISGGLFYHAIV